VDKNRQAADAALSAVGLKADRDSVDAVNRK
jgi:hypothetical protein